MGLASSRRRPQQQKHWKENIDSGHRVALCAQHVAGSNIAVVHHWVAVLDKGPFVDLSFITRARCHVPVRWGTPESVYGHGK